MKTGHDDFDAMFRTLFVPAYHLALRILGTPEDAKDAASEAMARALADWRRVSRLSHAGPWVLRVTSNVAIDMVRRRRAVPDSNRVVAALGGIAAVGHDADARHELVMALAALPRRQLEVVILRYLADLPEDEVAASLGIGIGTVKSHAARGRDQLRRVLQTIEGKEPLLAY